MSKYVWIANGLRGCYMPDNSYVVRVTSRRELKAIVEGECDDMRDAFGFGGTKAEIASVCAAVWRQLTRKRYETYPYAIGFGRSRATNDRPFGVFVHVATRADYLEQADD